MRHTHETAPQAWRCGQFVIDQRQRLLLRDGIAIDVEERAFDLIVLLAAQHDRAVDRRVLTDALWGARPVGEATLRQVIYKARQALGDDGRRQAVIRTLHGRSLRWVAPIEPLHGAAGERVAAAAAPGLPAVPHWRDALPRGSVAARWIVALVLLVTAGGALLFAHAPAVAPPLVAVVPIDNATGQHALDWTRDGLPGVLSSLLEAAGAHVADAHSTRLAWLRNPASTAARDSNVRTATGAAVVVGGRLRRIDESNYELDLDVRGRHSDDSIRVRGEWPGALAAEAAARLRDVLGFDAPRAHPASQRNPQGSPPLATR